MQQQLLSGKIIHLIISIVAGCAFYGVMSVLCQFTENGALNAPFRVFGGGHDAIVFLKILLYIAFIYGVLDLRNKQNKLVIESNAFGLGILPVQDQSVLQPNDVDDIHRSVRDLEKRGFRLMLLDFVRKTCTQFRNDNNIADTIQVMEGQFEASKNEREGDLETVRYLIQTIPMMGFVGTIVELTASLQKLGEKNDALNKVREAMSGAFDATLVALTLTIFLTFYYHRYIGELDVFFGRMKAYILEHLISRIIPAGMAMSGERFSR